MSKRIAKPDYNYSLETLHKEDVADKIFFGNDVLILKCIEGNATIQIVSEEHQFETGTNFLLLDSVMLKILSCSNDFTMNVLRFSSNFFNEIYAVLDSNFINVVVQNAPDLYSKEKMKLSDSFFEQLCLLYHQKEHTFRDKMAMNITKNYLYEIYEQTCGYTDNESVPASDSKDFLLNRFFDLCTEYHTVHRNIDFYTEKLNITGRYLFKLCKERMQMTPKESIDYFVTGTAKRLLLSEDLNNQQIADKLNFPDQSTFGQFFKRNVGMSPSEFRKKYK
ncbi:MAG: helix-turn-helix domain-containing protein [Bacteroidales bacterium]|nr:helix-turn-helix domain-containing protein [Bacteroidales bacterium]MDD3914276.1 helix-turn-helix domain-containing protein [Bacteroidales bacterium]